MTPDPAKNVARLCSTPEAFMAVIPDMARSGLHATRMEHDPRWLSTYAGEDGTRGHALVVYRGENLVAMLPFLHRPSHRLRLRLGELRAGSLPFPLLQLFGDLLMATDPDAAAAACRALLDVPLPFLGLSVEETPAASPHWQALSAASAGRFRLHERSRAQHHVVDLPATHAEYLAGFSKKSRYNMGRRTRLLDEAVGPLSLQVHMREDEVHGAIAGIEDLVRKTFHYRVLGQDITTSNAPQMARFRQWAGFGWFRCFVLAGRDGPIAYAIGFLVDGTFYYEMPGYDPDLADLSPGNELLAQIIQHLIESGSARQVDFGAGDAGYKQFFGNRQYEELAALLAAGTLRANAFVAVERAFAGISARIVSLLDRLGLKARIKALIRRRAPPVRPG